MKSKLQTLRDLLYENEKKMVFSEAEAPLSVEEKKAFAETLKSFSVMAQTMI